MTDEKWGSAYALFNEASRLPRERRRAFIENASVDPEIALRILELLDEADANEASCAGTRIGRYEVIDWLGRGGMGEVYSARDTELDRYVALKFLSPELHGGLQFVERFIREAKAASALNHPNIITVYEVAQSESRLAIAMELVDGRALREYCGAPVPAGQVAAWGRQIAQALAAAHASGIVHRDIKPENLMARRDGYIKVLDFGLARREIPSAQSNFTNPSGLLGGTLNYMSPEQTRGERATAASDIFSLGIVLFELAAGKHPFLSDSPVDTAHAIAHDEPEFRAGTNAEIPLPLALTIAAMLAKDPRQRLTAEEAERRLGAIGPDNTQQTSTAKVRLKRSAIAAAVLALCAASALGLWTVWERVSAPKDPVMRQMTTQAGENRVTAAALSPDGKTLAFAALGEPVQLRRMSDGLNQSMPTPEGMHANRIAWFSDRSKLLVSGIVAGAARSGIWILPVSGGQPVRVMPAGEDGAPSPDGRRIAFTSSNGAIIWIAETGGGAARQVRGGGNTSSFSALVWSPDSKRISYQRQEFAPPRDRQVQGNDSQLEKNYAYSFESADADTGRVIASLNNFVMTSACTLLDGRVLFLRWNSFKETTTHQLWELSTDPRTGAILGPPKQLTSVRDTMLSSVSAADNEKGISVIWSKHVPNIYVADLPAANTVPKLLNIRRLSFSLENDFPHAWTPDSRTVIFESRRNGQYDLFRQGLDRREAEPLVVSRAADKVLAQVSPDGKWILYRQDTKNGQTLMRVPMDGGSAEELLPTAATAGEFRCGLQPGSRCVLRLVENDQFIFHELDPVRGKGRELTRTVWSPTVTADWDISPDALMVAIPNHDPLSAKIRTFPLDGSHIDVPERTVIPEGLRDLRGLVWAADGRGWYVCANLPAGYVFSFVDLEGRSRELLRLPGWGTYAVPSPDRRRIAFPQVAISSNVFMIDGLRSRSPWQFPQ